MHDIMITMVPVAQRNVSSPFGFIMRRALISFEVRMGPDLLLFMYVLFLFILFSYRTTRSFGT